MRLMPLYLAPLLGACTIHLHVHEAPDSGEEAPAAWEASAPAAVSVMRSTPEAPAGDDHSISGSVHDDEGNPVAAHVALVRGSGSVSMGIGEHGRFRFDGVRGETVTVTASTKDGRIAIVPDVDRGTRDLVLPPVESGAHVTVTMHGRETMRVALFDGDVRFSDNTVREGKPASFVVPARPVRVRIYGDGFEEEVEAELSVGAKQELLFHFEDES